ncbi:hypothetical protein ABN028_17820 [Actinopolymorpha sp. B17G11]|uniref:hypothetical protein n=1 Tax=unclassified Actinopolymorpha TaxID=2627063 RepID=UPI0032D9448E
MPDNARSTTADSNVSAEPTTAEPAPAPDEAAQEASAALSPSAPSPSAPSSGRADGRRTPGDRKRPTGSLVGKVREMVATVVFAVAVLAALVMALGAILTALEANQDNEIVAAVLGLAGRLDGPFADVFTFADAMKQTLVNWGIAAAVYLVVGRVVERVVRP